MYYNSNNIHISIHIYPYLWILWVSAQRTKCWLTRLWTELRIHLRIFQVLALEKRPYLLSSDEDTGDKMMTTVISMRCQISRFLRRQIKKGVLSGEKYNNLRKTPSSKLWRVIPGTVLWGMGSWRSVLCTTTVSTLWKCSRQEKYTSEVYIVHSSM